MQQLKIYRGRTAVVPVSLGYDASSETFTSELRAEKDRNSTLLATWVVSFATDGVDGELVLTLDDTTTNNIVKNVGYMDIKRISNGEPLNVLDEPIEVLIKTPITA